jgi:hypothetical protein
MATTTEITSEFMDTFISKVDELIVQLTKINDFISRFSGDVQKTKSSGKRTTVNKTASDKPARKPGTTNFMLYKQEQINTLKRPTKDDRIVGLTDEEYRLIYEEEDPDKKLPDNINNIISYRWKQLSDEQKQAYKDKAKQCNDKIITPKQTTTTTTTPQVSTLPQSSQVSNIMNCLRSSNAADIFNMS